LENLFFNLTPTTQDGSLKLTLGLGESKLMLNSDGMLALDIGNTLRMLQEKLSEMLPDLCFPNV